MKEKKEILTVYERLLKAGVKKEDITNWCSDLYVVKSEESTNFVNEYEFKCNVTTFTSETDNKINYEIPMCYDYRNLGDLKRCDTNKNKQKLLKKLNLIKGDLYCYELKMDFKKIAEYEQYKKQIVEYINKHETIKTEFKKEYEQINNSFNEIDSIIICIKHKQQEQQKEQQELFINSLLENFKNDILKNLEKFPADWDNKHIREYIQQKAEENCFAWGSYRTKERKKKVKNDIIVNNL